MKKIFYLFLCTFIVLVFQSTKTKAQVIASYSHAIACWSPLDSGTLHETGYAGSDSLIINFGDGTTQNFLPGWTSGTNAYYNYFHIYTAPGTYTVTIVLMSGGVPVDTVVYSLSYTPCRAIRLELYSDNNSNCVFDVGDNYLWAAPAVIKVDSAGVPVDTFTSNWGVYYAAYGPVGTVYTFTVITNPHGLLPTCPTTGVASVTISSLYTYYAAQIGFECDPTACLDRATYADMRAGLTGGSAHMYISASSCTAVSTTATLTFSPKYTPLYIYGGASHSVSGNVITYNLTGLTATSPQWVGVGFSPVGTLTLGDTAQTTFSVPGTGDCNLSNNVVFAIDTIRASYDPNQKSVKPGGDIAPGTQLEYTLLFENDGNDTAHNIHLLDTLSDNLDVSTIRQIASSAECHLIMMHVGSYNIVKFDFPNIMLPDSSHHGLCHGFVAFTIKAKSTLTPGMHVDNRAGIYFDSNPVVMTNPTRNSIPLPTAVSNVSVSQVHVYPNPVNDELTIKAEAGSYQSVSVTNMLGQVVMAKPFDTNTAVVNVKGLPAGIYYVTLRGDSGVKVQKFEKK